MMISAQASAMRLELYPQPIGKIFSYNYNDFKIDGATQIKGDLKKGVVRFGEDFYLHFDCETIYNRFGDRDKKIPSTSILTAKRKFIELRTQRGTIFIC